MQKNAYVPAVGKLRVTEATGSTRLLKVPLSLGIRRASVNVTVCATALSFVYFTLPPTGTVIAWSLKSLVLMIRTSAGGGGGAAAGAHAAVSSTRARSGARNSHTYRRTRTKFSAAGSTACRCSDRSRGSPPRSP